MTLQEKIQKKAEGYGKLSHVFLEGAKFALENQWISVEDDLPCNHEELIDPASQNFTVDVMVRFDNGMVLSAIMTKNIKGKWKWIAGCDFSHWMPIPKFPKE